MGAGDTLDAGDAHEEAPSAAGPGPGAAASDEHKTLPLTLEQRPVGTFSLHSPVLIFSNM